MLTTVVCDNLKWLWCYPHGRRDCEVTGLGFEGEQLRENTEYTLGMLATLSRDAIITAFVLKIDKTRLSVNFPTDREKARILYVDAMVKPNLFDGLFIDDLP